MLQYIKWPIGVNIQGVADGNIKIKQVQIHICANKLCILLRESWLEDMTDFSEMGHPDRDD